MSQKPVKNPTPTIIHRFLAFSLSMKVNTNIKNKKNNIIEDCKTAIKPLKLLKRITKEPTKMRNPKIDISNNIKSLLNNKLIIFFII